MVRSEPRAHPWRNSSFEGGGSYHDFKERPELIREVLEDFKPFERHQSVQTFYNFLAYLNGPDSHLESNDCALRAPRDHQDLQFAQAGLTLKIDGRIELLYREISHNLSFEGLAWLVRRYFYELCFLNTDFRDGMVEIGMRPTYFGKLDAPANERHGQRLYLQFRAYGCGEAQVWANLNTVFGALHIATENINKTIGV